MSNSENVVNAILQEPVKVTIKVDKPNFLHKIGVLPKQMVFNVKSLHPATVMRMSVIVNSIKQIEQDKNTTNMFASLISKMETDMPKLVEILAYALTNEPKKPSERIKNFIASNAGDSFYSLFEMVISKMNVQGFMTSIISVSGMSLIPEEIIAPEAPGESSEDSSNTTGAPLNTHSGE